MIQSICQFLATSMNSIFQSSYYYFLSKKKRHYVKMNAAVDILLHIRLKSYHDSIKLKTKNAALAEEELKCVLPV